jgi:hypothetical protein
MSPTARALIVIGIVFVIAGIAVAALPSLPFGRLPGDLRIERPGVRVYLPLGTSLLLSVVLSVAFWLFSRWR